MAAALANACRETGFVHLTGHRVERRVILAMREMTAAFFRLPAEEKRALCVEPEGRDHVCEREPGDEGRGLPVTVPLPQVQTPPSWCAGQVGLGPDFVDEDHAGIGHVRGFGEPWP